MFSDLILTKSFPAAIRRVREHRALGHRTVLITGALDVAIAPATAVRRHHLRRDGRRRRHLHRRAHRRAAHRRGPGPGPHGRLRLAHDLDPAESVAYADSTSDLPMLEAVGFPVAVNPEARLSALARKRGWLVEHFDKAQGGAHPLLPIGPAWTQTTARAR
jgi:alcohol-forming fatty acyl-CoA reductase